MQITLHPSVGSVRIVKERGTGLLFACKTIPKAPPDRDPQGPKLGSTQQQRRRQALATEAHLERLRCEVSTLQTLKGCLNVVELHQVFEDVESVHIVMELCRGGELWHRVGDRHYSERTVIAWAYVRSGWLS